MALCQSVKQGALHQIAAPTGVDVDCVTLSA